MEKEFFPNLFEIISDVIIHMASSLPVKRGKSQEVLPLYTLRAMWKDNVQHISCHNVSLYKIATISFSQLCRWSPLFLLFATTNLSLQLLSSQFSGRGKRCLALRPLSLRASKGLCHALKCFQLRSSFHTGWSWGQILECQLISNLT